MRTISGVPPLPPHFRSIASSFTCNLLHFPSSYSSSSLSNSHLFLQSVREQSKLGFTNIEVPLSLFHHMNSMRPLPSIVDFCMLFSAMCTLGHWKQAQDLWTEMLGNNIRPTIETFNMLIDMCCKEGKVAEARDIFQYMVKIGQVPDIITYNSLLDGYCLRGEVDEAERLMGLMVKDGCKPDVVTYSCLINGYCKYKKVYKALALFQVTQSSNDPAT